MTNNRTSKALNVVAKHMHHSNERPSVKTMLRNIDLGSLVIAHPNLYRNTWHNTARKRAKNTVSRLARKVASYEVPIRDVDPAVLRKMHQNGDLAITLAEHEYWHPESDPRDVEYYLKHSKHHVIGLGPDEAMTLPDLTEQQQTRIIKAALCGRQPFRATGLDSKYTVMGETLVNIWNMLGHWSVTNMYMDEEIDEIRTTLMRAVLKAYRACYTPRSTVHVSRGTVKNAMADIDRLFAYGLTTNAARNRAAAGVRRVVASVPRSRLAVGTRALELAMREYARYLTTRWYIDPFLSPYADVFKTIFKSVS
jgi:hypothetical protein